MSSCQLSRDRVVPTVRLANPTGCNVFRIESVAVGSLALIAAFSSLANGQTKQMKSIDSSASELITRLQSDVFSIRQQSMLEIMENPEPVIPLMESAIECADRDFRVRSLEILEQVALKRTSSTSVSDLAFDTIRRISLSGNQTLSQRASQSSCDILLHRQYRASLKLERLNAKVSYMANSNVEKHPLASHLIIDQQWDGTRQDMELVPLLFGLSTLELSHVQVDDQLVGQLDSMYTLSEIKLKKCSITDASISHLSRIDSLNQVEIHYCRIGPGCFVNLAQFKNLTTLSLYGTNVATSQAAFLKQTLAANVDIRRGAFMGIRNNPTVPACILTSTVPGSGAEQAGLHVGDQIIQFNRSQIREHGELTNPLRENASGKQAKVKIIRNGEELWFDVLMGDWD